MFWHLFLGERDHGLRNGRAVMKGLLKKLVNKAGYEIIGMPDSLKYHHGDVKADPFIQEERFEVEFSRLTLDDNTFFVPKYAIHRPAVRNLFDGKLYEPKTHEFVKDFCSEFEGSIVHAGTFFGDMIPNFSKYVSGNVYAFEPVFENYVLAKLCLDANNLLNVILINAALSEKLTNLLIQTEEDGGKHAGGASMIANKGKICAAINIDRLALDDLILIQLDVEGHERVALSGAVQTIQRNRPVIAIEDNDDNCADFLGELGYQSIGSIPGLKLWLPKENSAYFDKVSAFLGE